MPSRYARVMIASAQGDPFIHKKLIGKAFKFGKKFLGKLLNPGTKTAAVLGAAGAAATGAALVTTGQQIAAGQPLGQALITAGTRFVFDPTTGQHVPMKKRRRRRGITATELSGFRKVNRLLSSVGMTPRKTRRKS